MLRRSLYDVHARAALSRRRLIGLGAGAAAFAAACGGDDKDSGSTGAGPGSGQLVTSTAQAATTKQPKPGGSLSFQIPTPPPAFDPFTQASFLCSAMNGLSYSKLYRFKAGVPEVAPGDISMEPDLAQTMPEQADQTTLTMKLKPAKFQALPPLNGREVTADDVRYAIERYQTFEKSVHQTLWSFLDTIETPDRQTVTLKLKVPYADAVQIMGGNLGAYIVPKEWAETPDVNTKMVGSGPYFHTEYQTGVSVSFKKNPDYYDKPFPYLDELKAFIVTDQAKRVADFSARSVDVSYLNLPDERDQLKKNRPDAKFDEYLGSTSYVFMRTDRPPWNDRRVRQALSMAINRPQLRQALLKGEGVDDQALWVGMAGWAKPVKDLSGAKYWQYNPAEAKKLLEAAGVGNPTWTWDHADASVYGQQYVDIATLTQAQWKDVGITIKDQPAPYAQFISTTALGQYEQVGHVARAVPYWVDVLTNFFSWGASGRARANGSYVQDDRLNALLDKQRAQYDEAERKKTVNEIQDLISEEQWYIYWSAPSYTYFWNPAVTNYRPHNWFPQVHYMRVWKET